MTDAAIGTLAEAVEAHYEELRSFVLRRTGSPVLTADILQEVWLRAAKARPEGPILNQRAYLYRVAERVAADHLRRDRIEAQRSTGDLASAHIVDPAPGPEQTAAAREEFAILCAAVDELPRKCRAAFLLYRGRGLSMREVADTLGVSQKTVEKHVAKAMLHCRRRLLETG